MERFERQRRIPRWDQRRLEDACVAVCGRDWLGTFTVWALASLGIGNIVWLGQPSQAAAALGNWFLATPCPFSGCAISDYPLQVEYGSELAWALGEHRTDALVCCSEDAWTTAVCGAFAQAHHITFLAGTTAQGGWYGAGTPPGVPQGQEPIVAMVLAALLADAVRETLCPLARGLLPPDGPLRLPTPTCQHPGTAVLVGVGGIGVYVATLAAILGYRLCLIDFDQVEETNLNRQGLFTPEDVQQRAYKAVAAREALTRLFPNAHVSAAVHRVGADFQATLTAMHPSVLLSAVDNAPTRLLLQGLGRALDLPVVQGGTDTFAADCYTQAYSGSLLDEQMHGALSEAAARETPRAPRGGCAADPSYIVPGMLAGALMAYRLVQVCERSRGLPPIRWRAGSLPVEQRSLMNGFDFTDLTV